MNLSYMWLKAVFSQNLLFKVGFGMMATIILIFIDGGSDFLKTEFGDTVISM